MVIEHRVHFTSRYHTGAAVAIQEQRFHRNITHESAILNACFRRCLTASKLSQKKILMLIFSMTDFLVKKQFHSTISFIKYNHLLSCMIKISKNTCVVLLLGKMKHPNAHATSAILVSVAARDYDSWRCCNSSQ